MLPMWPLWLGFVVLLVSAIVLACLMFASMMDDD